MSKNQRQPANTVQAILYKPIWPPLQKVQTVLPVPPFLDPALFPLCDAHLREDVDSQVRWWRIRILLVGAAVTGTDWLSIYPFTGVLLAFSSFFCCFNIEFLKIYIFLFFIFFYFYFNLFNFTLLLISFFFFLSFFLFHVFFYPTFFLSFFYFLSLISFPLFFSPLGFFLIWVCIVKMSIGSKFVFEFIVWVMVTMLVHSTCQVHPRTCAASATCLTWVNDFQRHAWESTVSIVLHLKPFLSQVN